MINALISKRGMEFVSVLLRSVAGVLCVPRSLLQELCDVIYSLLIFDQNLFQNWASTLLQTNGFPNTIPSAEKKQKFLKDILSTRHKKIFKKIISEFAVECRNLGEFGLMTMTNFDNN